jgi:hypothetical protein
MANIKYKTPGMIAQEIVDVQPMTGLAGQIFTMKANWIKPVLLGAKWNPFAKQQIYEVQTSLMMEDWLRETFPGDERIVRQQTLKGVWTDMPEDVYMLLKLKFS